MSKMMRKMWNQGNELVLRTQLQLRESLRDMTTVSTRLGKGQGGATMVEYAILVALISVAAIVIIVVLGQKIEEVFNAVWTAIDNEV
jgi:pilus assembly protein Flp/PilA